MSFIQSRLQPKGFLDTAMEAIAAAAHHKKIAFLIELSDNLPDSFYSDKTKLSRVLATLADQAVRRTDQGGVTIRLGIDAAQTQGAPQMIFCVEDTGEAMDPHEVSQILDLDVPVGDWPREMANSDMATMLRMASKLVSHLGGKLVCECAGGKTTKFSFSIPCRQDEPKEISATPSPKPVSQPINESQPSTAQQNIDVRILIVDDVEENRILLEVLLRKLGYKASFCANGQEAVDLCQKELFDVILMDVQMPVMDGMEATKRIRAEGMNTRTTIFALTASVLKSDELAILGAGCDDCITKPVDRKKLERKLGRIVARIQQVQTADQGGEIFSFLEGDPDYQKAIEMFVDNLPNRVEEIKGAYEKGDMKDFAFKVHALKGLGGFAGFPVFTEKAKLMEETLQANEIDKLHTQVDELVQLCLQTKLKSGTQS
jgi:CheY-like chemotaxis protein/HPt (histidine-containing phosphotransfer) domain-containing protein